MSWPANSSVITWSRTSLVATAREPSSSLGVEQQREDVLARARRSRAGGRSRRRSPVEPRPRAVCICAPRACAGRAASAASSRRPSRRAPLELVGQRRRRRAAVGVEARTARASPRAAPGGASSGTGRARAPARQSSSARSASSTMIVGRRGDPLAVEGGQHDPARAPVVVAVDRQQAVAEQRDQVAHAPSRQRKFDACETVRRFASGPSMNTTGRCRIRIENTGP